MNINAKNKHGATALIIALELGKVTKVELLLKEGGGISYLTNQ